MAKAKVVTGQTDFSAGELDVEVKRDNKNPLMLAGARQASNFRILNAKGLTNRPGRRAFVIGGYGRVDEVLMAPGRTFYLAFGNSLLTIFDSTGAVVFSQAGPAWTALTAKNIVWALYDKTIYFTFAGQVPLYTTWDGASTFSALVQYAETISSIGHKQTPFYRIAPKGITMQPAAATGVGILLTASANYFVVGMIGTRLRYNGSQMTITAVADPLHAAVTIHERLLGAAVLTFTQTINATWTVGQVIEGSLSGAKGQIISFPAGNQALVMMLNNLSFNGAFAGGESVIGIGGVFSISGGGGGVVASSPVASPNWDEEVMNVYRGYPASVFVDQNRLGFCDFPALPIAIAWSEVANFNNLEPGANPTDPIFELVPGKRRVMYVIPGMDASEFIFCDNGLLYIPITPANPLKPGSVTFNTISEDEIGAVMPRRVGEIIIYAAGGLADVMVVKIFGAYTRAYKTECVTELSGHMFAAIVGIAVMTSAANFPERYVFILNADGTVVAGKYSLGKSNDLEAAIGWTPWSGSGLVQWVSCKGGNITFATIYGATTVVEQIDDTLYLDAATLVNPPGSGVQQAQPTGTNFGTMTTGGGLAAVFDGVRLKDGATSASAANPNGFVGRQFTVPRVIGQALVWPSTNNGFTLGGAGNITIELRAKQTLPASFVDGTLLASVTLTVDQLTGPVVLQSTDLATVWNFGFIGIQQAGATNVICAQLLMQTGALWWLPGGSVDLMDQVTRAMGTYVVDAVGNIVPQGNGGEDLTRASLVAGKAWTARLERFVPPVTDGQDIDQRMNPRRLAEVEVYVKDSSGFLTQRLYSGQSGPLLPANGTPMAERRISTWNQGEDPTLPPPLREQAYRFRPLGRSHDPRWQIVKDTPGPLTVLEIGMKPTV